MLLYILPLKALLSNNLPLCEKRTWIYVLLKGRSTWIPSIGNHIKAAHNHKKPVLTHRSTSKQTKSTAWFLPHAGAIAQWLSNGTSGQRAAVSCRIIRFKVVRLFLVWTETAAVVFQAIWFGLEALRLRTIEIHGATSHWDLRLGHMAIVVLADGESVAVLRPVTSGHVRPIGPVVDSARETSVVVGHVSISIVKGVMAKLTVWSVIVGVAVIVVRACEGGSGLGCDEAFAVLHVAPINGVGVAPQWRWALWKRKAVGTHWHLSNRSCCHCLDHLSDLRWCKNATESEVQVIIIEVKVCAFYADLESHFLSYMPYAGHICDMRAIQNAAIISDCSNHSSQNNHRHLWVKYSTLT